KIEETKRLWTLGNYSRFVRPGAVRLEVETDNEVVRASAYRNATSGTLTLVVINNSVDPQVVTFADVDTNLPVLNVYETSAAQNLAPVYSGAAQATYTLAPTSVTTFVFQTDEGA
ncbi:MAG TPA: glycoside hydrolase family 30 beta sandwich domain-containing protein, partial [Phototrophicaceae bacterium]|nr:glycoside hydrolase family 30 beta sandwich domain-containing protein [Phototrophicaceae bacterium]